MCGKLYNCRGEKLNTHPNFNFSLFTKTYGRGQRSRFNFLNEGKQRTIKLKLNTMYIIERIVHSENEMMK